MVKRKEPHYVKAWTVHIRNTGHVVFAATDDDKVHGWDKEGNTVEYRRQHI